MSVYLVKGKGWRYDFHLKGERHTEAYFKTKAQARRAEEKRKEDLGNPKKLTKIKETPTAMAFSTLLNLRLDHVKAYNSESHYREYVYLARRWVKKWGSLACLEITREMVERHFLQRSKISAYTANKEIRYLRSTFNFGIKRGYAAKNPTKDIEFLPIQKKIKYVPSPDDIDRVIEAADQETKEYLLTIRDTMGRVNEINSLTWDDVNFEERYVILYTRKKKGGHRTPRKVPMTQRLCEILSHRYFKRDKSKPWVFWHTYTSSKTREVKTGPYKDRKRIMKSLCRKAGVRYFRFHALRHSGASVMDSLNIPIGDIQRILGHENRNTTEIYLHSISDSERTAIARFEQARQNSHTNSHTEKNEGVDQLT